MKATESPEISIKFKLLTYIIRTCDPRKVKNAEYYSVGSSVLRNWLPFFQARLESSFTPNYVRRQTISMFSTKTKMLYFALYF